MSQTLNPAHMGISDIITDYLSLIGQLLDELSPEHFPASQKASYETFQRVHAHVTGRTSNWDSLKAPLAKHILFKNILQVSASPQHLRLVQEDPVYQSWEELLTSIHPLVNWPQTLAEFLGTLKDSFQNCPETAQTSWQNLALRAAGIMAPEKNPQLPSPFLQLLYSLVGELAEAFLSKKSGDLRVICPNANTSFDPPKRASKEKYTYISQLSEYYYFLTKHIHNSPSENSSYYALIYLNPLAKIAYGSLSQQIHLFDSQNLLFQPFLAQVDTDIDLLFCDLRESSHTLSTPSSQLEKRIKNTWGKLPTYYRNKKKKPLTYLLRWCMDRMSQKGITVFVLDREYLAQNTSEFLKKSWFQEYQQIYLWESPPTFSGSASRNQQISIVILVREKAFRPSRKGVPHNTAQVFYRVIGEEKRLNRADFKEISPDQFFNKLYPSNLKKESVLPLFTHPEASTDQPSNPSIFQNAYPPLLSPWKNQVLADSRSKLEAQMKTILEAYQKAQPGELPKSIAWPKSVQKFHEQKFPIQFRKNHIQEVWAQPYARSYAYVDPLFLDQAPAILDQYSDSGKINPTLLWGIKPEGNLKIRLSIRPAWKNAGFPEYQIPLFQALSSTSTELSTNIPSQTLEYFQAYYQGQWQAWAYEIKEASHELFDFTALEQCQVSPEFAGEVRSLFEWTQKGQHLDHLSKYLSQAQEKTSSLLKEWGRLFRQAYRRMDQMGKKIASHPESREVIEKYFQTGMKALEYLENHLDQVQQKLRPHNLDYEITERDIFAYTYAVLQSPIYQGMCDLYRHQDVPLIPLFTSFLRWKNWGNTLLNLQLKLEEQAPWRLKTRVLPKADPDGKECFHIHPDIQEITLEFSSQRWILSNLPEALWESTSFDLGEILAILLPPKTAKEASISGEEANPQAICEQLARICRVAYETHLIYAEMHQVTI